MHREKRQSNKTRSPTANLPEVDWAKTVSGLFEQTVGKDLHWEGNVPLVLGAIRGRHWDTVLQSTKARPPQMYGSAAEYFAAAQVECLFKKLPVPGNADLCKEAAMLTFLEDEHRNLRTNQRLEIFRRRGYMHKNALYTRLFARMQRFVLRVLGEDPDFGSIAGHCDFGPGATNGVGGDSTHPYAKLQSHTVTGSALPYVLDAYWSNDQMRRLYLLSNKEGYSCYDPLAFREEFMARAELVTNNNISFVPKNARTHRITASEPTCNGFYQNGLGVEIATRLRRARPFISIWDQTRNQRMAKEASKSVNQQTNATLDMKSASQSLTRQLVKGLFEYCPRWFDAMNSVRSIDWRCAEFNTTGRYELFTSMGNGFCFPLQTLIFSAAVEAVYEETGCTEYGVYGDDIICSQNSALMLIEWLRFLGVRTNTDKSFVFGPFRESCGADFFNGENVRPFVLDFLPSTIRDVVKLANGITRIPPTPLWGAWWGLWNKHKGSVQRYLRPHCGPDDTGLTVPIGFYDLHALGKWDAGLQRRSVTQFRSEPIADLEPYAVRRSPDAQLFLALRGCTDKFQKQVAMEREHPIQTNVEGTPTPCYRRKSVHKSVTC